MRQIFLASDSKAREKLLKMFGLKFKTVPSGINEKISRGNLSYAALVKHNALIKASSAAKKIKAGLIIAADTITVQDGLIFGKPKNLKEAAAMLKKLSAGPQWVYTGIAVIDKDSGRQRVDYEKTKVFMDKLNDKEIMDYFSRVSPLDKAGAFDIQGKGAFFIRRIEGCFYNVVGLPLRKLYRILKTLDVRIFTLLLCTLYSVLCTLLSGCATEYNIVTRRQELFYYSTDREVKIGQAVAAQVEKQYKLADDPLLQKRVEDIGRKIVEVCDRKDIDYHFKVLADEEINAVALPGGFVYVNKGLLDKTANDNELAGVLAHEVGHIVARHSIKKLQGMMAYSMLRILTVAIPNQSGEVTTAADIAFTEIMLGYSREDELLADQLAARYAKRAGYNPYGMIDFLKTLQDIDRRKPLKPKIYFKTHPYVPDRIRVVKQELGEPIGFSDYINIETKPRQ